MTEFFAICEYFSVTPAEFFRPEVEDPLLARETTALLERLSAEDLRLVRLTAERLNQK